MTYIFLFDKLGCREIVQTAIRQYMKYHPMYGGLVAMRKAAAPFMCSCYHRVILAVHWLCKRNNMKGATY